MRKMRPKPPRRWLRAVWAGGACTAACIVGGACWSPTQVTLSVSTDLACQPTLASGQKGRLRIGMYVGGESQAETEACAERAKGDTSIGELALVPAGSRSSSASVQVVMTNDGADLRECFTIRTDPITHESTIPGNCVIARRAFRFLAHTDRRIPIRLDSRCLGVACPETETCVVGRCAPANVDGNGFVNDDELEGAPRDATLSDGDGQPDTNAPDGGADAADAAGSCVLPDGGSVLYDGNEASEDLAVDDENVFWTHNADPGGAAVRGIKRAGDKPMTVYAQLSPFIIGATWNAVATDGVHLYAGENRRLHVIDIATKNDPDGGPSLDIGTVALVADIGGAWVSGRTQSDPGVDQLIRRVDGDAKIGPIPLNTHGGTWIAYGASSQVVWAKDVGKVWRNPMQAGSATSNDVNEVHTIAACAASDVACAFKDEALVTHKTAAGIPPPHEIVRVSAAANPSTPTVLTSSEPLTFIAVEGDTVYYVEGMDSNARVRWHRPNAKPVGLPADLEGTRRYGQIKGLAVRGCVYFWASDPANPSGPFVLRVAPKAP